METHLEVFHDSVRTPSDYLSPASQRKAVISSYTLYYDPFLHSSNSRIRTFINVNGEVHTPHVHENNLQLLSAYTSQHPSVPHCRHGCSRMGAINELGCVPASSVDCRACNDTAATPNSTPSFYKLACAGHQQRFLFLLHSASKINVLSHAFVFSQCGSRWTHLPACQNLDGTQDCSEARRERRLRSSTTE